MDALGAGGCFGGVAVAPGSHGIGWSFGQDLVDESGRHGCSKNRAISGLFDFEAVKERLYIGVRTVGADAAFGGVKEAQKGGFFSVMARASSALSVKASARR